MNKKIFVIFDYKYIYDSLETLIPNYEKVYISSINSKNINNIKGIKNKNNDVYFIGGISALHTSFVFSKKIKGIYLFLTKKEYDNTNTMKKYMKKGLDYYTYIIDSNNSSNNSSNIISSNTLAKIVYNGCIQYPYYNIYYKFDKKHILKIVKNFKPVIYNPKNIAEIPQNMRKFTFDKYDDSNDDSNDGSNNSSYFIIKDDWKKNEELNNTTDYFSESVRVICSFGTSLSPLVYWENNRAEILENTIKKYKDLNIYNIREYLFEKTRFCNNFRISVGLAVLNHFKPKKWLDISSGWGDRLLCALLYKVDKYVSTDPNKDLHPCYNKIIQTFVPKAQRNKITIHKKGFEDLDLKDEMFDIVFSSPPFFTLEKYSSYEDNSITHYKDEKVWCEKFFIKSLIKCYNHLEKDGHMILYMGGSPYVFDQMFKLNNVMSYKGVIYFYDNKPRAMYVWKKLKDDKIDKL
jgi:hypothetical protein